MSFSFSFFFVFFHVVPITQYLYSPVGKFVILSEIVHSSKSIRVAFIVDIWVFSRLLPVQSCKTGNGFHPHIVAGKHLLIPLLFPRLPSQEAYVLSSLSQSLRHVNHLFIRPSPDTNVTDKAIEDQNKNMLCVHWVECWHKVWLMHC